MTAWILSVLLAVSVTGAPAPASPEESFYAAAELARSGHPAEAATAFVAVADRAPADAFADDALLEAARLKEEELGDPAGAAVLYERLVTSYPDSRLALRAGRRAEALRASLGPGGRDTARVAELGELVRGFADRPRAETRARLERLIAEHPDFADAPHALYWLGTLCLEDGDRTCALARWGEVARRWPDGEWAARALLAMGDAYLAAHDFEAAKNAYHSVQGQADPRWDEIAAESLGKLRFERGIVAGERVAWVVVVLSVTLLLGMGWRAGGGARGLARGLARPPTELWYLAPIALGFVLAGLTEHQSMGRAIRFVCTGGLVVTWLSGGVLDLARARLGRIALSRALVHAGLAALTVIALAYLAVVRNDLTTLVIETLRFGPEGS